MKKHSMTILSKIISCCLVLILFISTISVPVHATVENDAKATITVNGTEKDKNATINFYQIITVNFQDNQIKDPAYKWIPSVGQWIESSEEYKKYVNHDFQSGDYIVTEEYIKNSTEGERAKFLEALRQAIEPDPSSIQKNSTINIEPNDTKSMSGVEPYQATSDSLPMGSYLVLAHTNIEEATGDQLYEYSPLGINIIPEFNDDNDEWNLENGNGTLKSTPTSIDKTVDESTVSVGDTVTYTIDTILPKFPDDAINTTFNIGDNVSSGLTLDPKISENIIVTTGAPGENGTEVDENYYTFSSNPLNGQEGFKLTFFSKDEDYDYFKFVKDYGFPVHVYVQYTGTINENAIKEDATVNNAYLEQSNNPYTGEDYITIPTNEKVYTYGFEFTKIDPEAKEEDKLLPGAEFAVYPTETDAKNGKNPISFKKVDNVYVPDKGEKSSTVVVSGSDGKVIFDGLDENDENNKLGATEGYYIKETKAPSGYQLSNQILHVKLIDNEGGSEESADGDKPDGDLDHPGSINVVGFEFNNTKPSLLPKTGGMGTIIFSTVGVILMAGGIALVVSYRRRKRA